NCWKRKWSAQREGVGAHRVSTAAFTEDLVAKSYDRTLLRRLLTYLRPYQAAVAVSFLLIVVMAGLDLVGPYLTKLAIDRYITKGNAPGPARVAALYLLTLLGAFAVRYGQVYILQMTGQKVMLDMRRQIFGHLQRLHVGFFDRNPVGRLMTRVTTDVDAVNELFTSGVVTVFGDLFTLLGIMGVMTAMNPKLALVAFSQYSERFWRPISDLSEKFNILQAAMASSERIFTLLDSPAEVVSPPRPALLAQVRGRVAFEDVSFAYVPSQWVLRDVDFTVEAGRSVALVGATGA